MNCMAVGQHVNIHREELRVDQRWIPFIYSAYCNRVSQIANYSTQRSSEGLLLKETGTVGQATVLCYGRDVGIHYTYTDSILCFTILIVNFLVRPLSFEAIEKLSFGS
jgi:hypothetical protein